MGFLLEQMFRCSIQIVFNVIMDTRQAEMDSLEKELLAEFKMNPIVDLPENDDNGVVWSSEEEELPEEEEEEEEEVKRMGEEWWNSNWVWHYRDPYITPALMDKLAPYIEKLKKRPSWAACDKFLRPDETKEKVELSFEERWHMAREWYERENPQAFWEKQRKIEACEMEEAKTKLDNLKIHQCMAKQQIGE